MVTSVIKRGIAFFAAVTILSILSSPTLAQSDSINESSKYPYRNSMLITLGAASTFALATSTFEADKRQHFGISIAFGVVSESILRTNTFAVPSRWKRVALATTIGTIPGIAKEIADPVFSKGDLLADVLGAFTGAMLSDLIQGPMKNFSVSAGSDSMTVNWSMRY